MTAVTIPAVVTASAPAHEVYVRQRWADDWVLEPYLFALSAKQSAMPDISEAHLEWRYGEIVQHDDRAFRSYSLRDWLGWYVRIVIAPGTADQVTWIGVIQEQEDARLGKRINAAGGTVPTGLQHVVAFGLEVFLRRAFIRTSIVAEGAGTKTVNEAIPFNEPNPRANQGNRSANRGPDGVHVFTEDLDNAAWWSTRDIVEYLLFYYAPRDAEGFDRFTWQVAFSFPALPTWDRPHKDVQGMTLDQVLLDLIDRGRLMAWMVDVDATPAGAPVLITMLSFADQLLSLPSGATIAANPQPREVDFDNSVWSEATPLRTSASHRVDKVTVRGARATATFSLSPLDSTLESDWTAADETSYEAGHSGDAGYAALDVEERERANDLVRSQDALSRVYASFKLPDDWDGKINDGEGTGTLAVWMPSINAATGQDDFVNPEPIYRPAVRFLSELPALRQTDATAEASEFLRPLAVINIKNAAPRRYAAVEQLGRLAGVEGEGGNDADGKGGGLRFSGHLRMAEHDAAVSLRISGAPQHVIAGDDFTPLGAGEDDRWLPQLAWSDNLIVTVAAESRWVEVSEKTGAEADAELEVIIDLRDAARLDWIARDTIKGLTADGQLDRQGSGEFVRDDRPMMRDVAALAAAWYSVPRTALSLTVRRHFTGLAVGDLITTFGSAGFGQHEANSLVTAVTYDLVQVTTSIETEFAQLNPRALIA